LLDECIMESVMPREAATYLEIQRWVRERHGFTPQTCWIAHCKELYGLPLESAPNRKGPEREKECPQEKRPAILQAFRHFGMLP